MFLLSNPNQQRVERGIMEKWRCTVCGYIYDAKNGDPDNGIVPGTEFKDIPDSWVCPECGAPKSDFEKII